MINCDYKTDAEILRFASVGEGVQVFRFALILKPENISLGNYVRIDDYSRIEGGQGIIIGNYVHICSFASIYGGGSAYIGNFCGLSQGVRLITGTEQTSAVMTAAAPREMRNPLIGRIIMEPNSFIGANAVVMPDITIGEGAVIGAGAVVTKSVPPWSICTGVPAKVVGKRQKL